MRETEMDGRKGKGKQGRRNNCGTLENGLPELASEPQMSSLGIPPQLAVLTQRPSRVPKLTVWDVSFRSSGRRMTWTTTLTSSLCHLMAGSCLGRL